MTLNGKEYTEIKLLGKGKGGYSYLVTDGKKNYVLKQIHHEPCDYYTFGDKLASELNDYRRLSELGIPMPRLLEVDTENERILKEYVDGDTINVLIKDDRMKENYRQQMLSICEKLYAAGLNIDYYPTNFVAQDGILYYIDFECNDFMPEWSFEHWGVKYWSRTPDFLAYLEQHPSDGGHA